MPAPSTFAKEVFSKMKASGEETPMDDEAGEAPTLEVPSGKAVAGKAFGAAVKGGDGEAIASAFSALLEECQSEKAEGGYDGDAEV